MGGVRTLINSENTIKGNIQSALAKKLRDSNSVAKGIKSIPLKSKKNGKKSK